MKSPGTMKIPEGHQQLMPYFILNGAENFIKFTSAVFGAEVSARHEQPDGAGIMHAEIKIGDMVVMFADATDQWSATTGSIFIYVDSADDTYKKALAEGADSIMEIEDKEYGRSCGVKDPAGVTWWITSV